MIQLRGVTKTYNMGGEEIRALDAVNLNVKDGEFLAIIGPSGSGKTTLANIIGGLDSPTSGEAMIGEKDLSKLKDKELSEYRNKKIGFVFQTFNLQPSYTAIENVEVPLLFAKMAPKERKNRAIECLKMVGLEDRMNHKPNELSGGQRQRVSIARALSANPEIIIADEPTGNLDSKKGAEVMEILKALNKRGITLIIITHDLSLAKQAKRLIGIHDGKLVEGGRRAVVV